MNPDPTSRPSAPVYYVPPARTNTLAILAIVFTFIFFPAGLVCGILARREIRQTHEEGDGIALAAIIISGIFFAFTAIGFIMFFVVFAAIAHSAAGANGLAPLSGMIHSLRQPQMLNLVRGY